MEIVNNINISQIYDKNLNFLIGSGASAGLFPTLGLGIKNKDDKNFSYETLLVEIDKTPNEQTREKLKTLVFMAYYHDVILPVQRSQYDFNQEDNEKKIEVIDNYKVFIRHILQILVRSHNKTCNIFTTNYDGCFPFVADQILQSGYIDFSINDGTNGFFKKQLEARNYNQIHHRTGVFGGYGEQIPAINLIPLHGSVYWNLENEKIFVNYKTENSIIDLPVDINKFCELLKNEENNYNDLLKYIDGDFLPDDYWLTDEIKERFWTNYLKLPIVNPTKEKFHETVLKEHFYQMLRLMSYELEKKQTIFVVFGFSFADEHILNLIRRSLSNPNLQLYICCYSEDFLHYMIKEFQAFNNVKLIKCVDDDNNFMKLDFTNFNQRIFTLRDHIESPIKGEEYK